MGRSMIVKKVDPLSIECIFRGRLTGSYWNTYIQAPIKKTESVCCSFKEVCGFKFSTNLQENQEIKPPLFTPSTKADLGNHDENISLAYTERLVGKKRLAEIDRVGNRIYQRAVKHAAARGIIIADTKLEFGLTRDGKLLWIDEALTPDSSRFWPADDIVLGVTPPSFDKQFLRDYLLSLEWNKTPPPPVLPQEVIEGTQKRYEEIYKKLTLD
jgi:phosphoribosylaminoimidazole-succinocarboxamide synthase